MAEDLAHLVELDSLRGLSLQAGLDLLGSPDVLLARKHALYAALDQLVSRSLDLALLGDLSDGVLLELLVPQQVGDQCRLHSVAVGDVFLGYLLLPDQPDHLGELGGVEVLLGALLAAVAVVACLKAEVEILFAKLDALSLALPIDHWQFELKVLSLFVLAGKVLPPGKVGLLLKQPPKPACSLPVLQELLPRQLVALDGQVSLLALEAVGLEDKRASFLLQLPPDHLEVLVEGEVCLAVVDEDLLALDLLEGLDSGPLRAHWLPSPALLLLYGQVRAAVAGEGGCPARGQGRLLHL